MKFKIHSTLAAIAALTSSLSAQFESGSNGSHGPLVTTASVTLDVPPDGIFHFTTVNVGGVHTVTFRKNAANTPVYILATGDISLSGPIVVTGVRQQ